MSELENKRRFTFHFTQRYVELRGGYDIQKEDVFAGIVDKYFKLSKRIPPDDYAQFLAGITEREFKDDGYSWSSAASKFIADKLPVPPPPNKREEYIISEYSKGLVQIHCQRFDKLELEPERQIARALLMRELCDNLQRHREPYFENKISAATPDQIKRITEYLTDYKFTKHTEAKRKGYYRTEPMKVVDALSMRGARKE